MKLTDDTKQKAQLPDFWREGWLEEALHELETSNLTPEQRMMYEITIAGNMSEKYAREAEMEKEIQDRVKQTIEQAVEQAVEQAKEQKAEEAVSKLLKRATLTDQEIAEDLEVSLDFVKKVRQRLASSK